MSFPVWEATMVKNNGAPSTIVSTDINEARNHFWMNTQDATPADVYTFTMRHKSADFIPE